jgi:hypothetical protein
VALTEPRDLQQLGDATHVGVDARVSRKAEPSRPAPPSAPSVRGFTSYQTAIASMEGEGGVYHGHEGAREWLRDLDDALEELHGELDELYDLGDGR